MAFTIESKTENGFHKIILKDNHRQTSVEIVPGCGAILHAFTVLHNSHFINVIDHYASANDFADNAETKGFKSCKLSPYACRIKNATYHFGGKQFTLHKFLLNGSAIHGLLYDAVFTVSQQEANADKASVSLAYSYKGTEEGYPFFYDCIVKYTLEKDNTLHIKTEVINKDTVRIPIQDGWHPYFTLGGRINDLQLEFQSKEKIIFDKDMVPTGGKISYQQYCSLKKIGNENFDDCFSVNFTECQPMCVLRDSAQKIQVEIHPHESYPYLQVYTPPHRESIAIENLSAIPDAFNNGEGLITLAPATNAIFTTTYKITPLN
jgi:aldose 1-epimerase